MNLATFYQIEAEAEALINDYRESLAALSDDAVLSLSENLGPSDAIGTGLGVDDIAELIADEIEHRGLGSVEELTAEELAAFDAVAARQTIRDAADAIRSEVV